MTCQSSEKLNLQYPQPDILTTIQVTECQMTSFESQSQQLSHHVPLQGLSRRTVGVHCLIGHVHKLLDTAAVN